MRGAIASVEVFVREDGASDASPRRLTLTLTAPEPAEESAWSCRVALADLERPRTVVAPDSVTALARALSIGNAWLGRLRANGATLHRDREGREPFAIPELEVG